MCIVTLYYYYYFQEAVLHSSLGSSGMETLGSVNGIETAQVVVPASNHFIDLDGPNSDASTDDGYADPYFEEFDYAFLQSHFDKVGIPPGIEAPIPHIPWLSDPPKSNVSSVSGSSSVDTRCQMQSDFVGLQGNGMFPWIDPLTFNMKPTVVGSSSFKTQTDSISHHPKVDLSSSWKLPKAARSKKKQSAPHPQGSAPNIPVGVEPSKSQRLLGALQRKKKLFSSSSSANYSSVNKFDAMKFATGAETSSLGYSLPNSANIQAINSYNPLGVQSPFSWSSDPLFTSSVKPYHSSFYSPVGSIHPPGELAGIPWVKGVSQTQHNVAAAGLSTTPARQFSSKEIDEIMQKFKVFKQFDTVEDLSDHHYILSGTLSNSMTPVS